MRTSTLDRRQRHAGRAAWQPLRVFQRAAVLMARGRAVSEQELALQTGFLGVQKKDLRPRYVDYFTEERTKLAGLMMDLPGCDITLDQSGGVVCHRNEVGATGALPSGWERLSADNVEQMRFMDQNEFILCDRHEYHDGILKCCSTIAKERGKNTCCVARRLLSTHHSLHSYIWWWCRLFWRRL